jgi:RNA polymerase sigma-70 factor (ECF subfamily)
MPIKTAEAFSHIYQQNHLKVFRYIYSLKGGPREEVEDLTAETFLKAWKARYRFNGGEDALISWLFTIARRLVIDTFRHNKVIGYEIQMDDINFLTTGLTPEAISIQREQNRILFTLLGSLTLRHREILVLRYILGWRVNDIGNYLQIPENTVSVTIRRILTKIRNNWPADHLETL